MRVCTSLFPFSLPSFFCDIQFYSTNYNQFPIFHKMYTLMRRFLCLYAHQGPSQHGHPSCFIKYVSAYHALCHFLSRPVRILRPNNIDIDKLGTIISVFEKVDHLYCSDSCFLRFTEKSVSEMDLRIHLILCYIFSLD